MCPKEIWRKCFPEYTGDECKLYSDVFECISNLEDTRKKFGRSDILKEFDREFGKEYENIPDTLKYVNKCIDINVEEGFMPKNYRHLQVTEFDFEEIITKDIKQRSGILNLKSKSQSLVKKFFCTHKKGPLKAAENRFLFTMQGFVIALTHVLKDALKTF